MDYKKHYDALIKRAKDRVLSGYSERHHIVPRCLGGGDEPDNIVKLTAEEHYVAHQLLVMMHPKQPKLVWAAHMMATRPGNKLYGWLRRAMAEARRGTKQSPEHIAKLSRVRRGRILTPEHRANIGASVKGTRHSEEVRRRMSDAAKRRGISPDTREKINEALRGKKRGPLSDERKAAISAAKRANPYSHSEETKARMKASRVGRKLTVEHRMAIAAAASGRKRGPYKKG